MYDTGIFDLSMSLAFGPLAVSEQTLRALVKSRSLLKRKEMDTTRSKLHSKKIKAYNMAILMIISQKTNTGRLNPHSGVVI